VAALTRNVNQFFWNELLGINPHCYAIWSSSFKGVRAIIRISGFSPRNV